MTYSLMAALITDETFVSRVEVCAMEQAKVIANDGRTTGRDLSLAVEVIASMYNGARLVPIVATEPSFAELYENGGQESISDGMILAAVQQRWSTAALPFVPSVPTPPIEGGS
jgi:hypothetical protein